MAATTASADTWSGTIVLGPGVVVYLGPGATAARHRHDAIQIIISPARLVVVSTDAGTITTDAAIIASRDSHQFEADGAPIAIVLIEPSGRTGVRLDAVAQRSPDLSGMSSSFALPATTNPTDVIDWVLALVTSIIGDPPLPTSGDVRMEVRDACRFIDARLDHAPQLADTAHHVGYSPRQLRRIFADEFGMPYRRYILWRRMRHALLAVRSGADLTTAAAAAGFADSAHFSRTFRKTFGLTPSEVLPLLTVTEADIVDD